MMNEKNNQSGNTKSDQMNRFPANCPLRWTSCWECRAAQDPSWEEERNGHDGEIWCMKNYAWYDANDGCSVGPEE